MLIHVGLSVIMSLTQNCQKHYLAIRPVACEYVSAAPYIEPISYVTGIDQATIKQKIVGTALQVLKTTSSLSVLEEMQALLYKENFPSAIISKSDIQDHRNLIRATSLAISDNSVNLLSSQSETLLSFDGTSPCFIVLSCTNVTGIRNKRVATAMLQKHKSLSIERTLSFIFLNHPVMDIYTPDTPSPVRIDGGKFNYTTLGKDNKGSLALNFPCIIRIIKRFSSEALLDTGFGENFLPFLHSIHEANESQIIEDFSSYSRFVFLAYKKGLFKDVTKRNLFPLSKMGGISWAGPVLETDPEESKRIDECNTLPLPPEPGMLYKSTLSRQSSGLHLLANNISKIRNIGPPALVYPLAGSMIGFLNAWYIFRNQTMLVLGLLSAGVLLSVHAFVLLSRKRNIENCPTSKIRSVPMGEAEVNGHARQKYSLRAPYSLTECVYYSYKIYKTEMTPKGPRKVLSECGESGNIPFYLEDDTGKILIIPRGSVLKAGLSQTIRGGLLMDVLGKGYANDKKIVETIIPVGQFLYVKGFAHRVRISTEEKKKAFIERLRSIKKDRKRMKKYDLNHDGVISEDEWELARKDVEEELMRESLSEKQKEDKTAIGEHPIGGFFYITDKQEKTIIKSFAWRIPIFFVLGIGAIISALHMLYN